MIKKITDKDKSKQQVSQKDGFTISGTMTLADIKNNKIEIEEGEKKELHSIAVSTGMIKNMLRFYLGECVTIQLEKDAAGSFYLKHIKKAISV